MKNIILFCILFGGIIAISSCKKCQECTFNESGLDESFTYAAGDKLTVESGEANYNGQIYSKGDEFAVVSDTSLFGNGLQFIGTALVKRTLCDTFCDKGRSYKDMLDKHQNNGWKCEDYDE